MKTAFVLTFALALFPGPVPADVVLLTDGRQVEGRVTDLGDELRIELRFGTLTVPKSAVREVRSGASPADEYARRLARIDRWDADGHVALGAWLEARGQGSLARKEYRRALGIDPRHGGAHMALGHLFHEGRWRAEREVMERAGLVRMGGAWLSREEAASRRALAEREASEKEERRARRALERKLNTLVRDLAYGSQKECDAAYHELVAIARHQNVVGLEKFAGDVRDYYDRYWTFVRQSQTVQVEVSATQSSLKRPMRTFRTSLGGGTSPVSLQLPELSVASVRTVVRIPAGRGLP